jgi:membrane associated rhomboid family serine protease
MLHAPAGILWLIAALIAAHLGRLALGPVQAETLMVHYAFIPARYGMAFLHHGLDAAQVWAWAIPFVSYIFIHANFVHLGINCLWLLALGPVVARRFTLLWFLLFFFICGILAAGTVLVLAWGAAMAVIGASGAISGLMGAAIRMLPTPGPFGLSPAAKLAPLFSRPVLFFTLIWVVINLVMGLTSFGTSLTGGGAIAWQAHIGGYLAGLLLAKPFDRLSVEFFNHNRNHHG